MGEVTDRMGADIDVTIAVEEVPLDGDAGCGKWAVP